MKSLKKKKIWLSISLIAVVAGGAAVATYAYFTAQRTTTANKFTTGTLNMDVMSNGNKVEPFVIDNLGEEGGLTGTKTWTIKNTGTLTGRLLVRLLNVTNDENGCNDQEKEAEPTCDQAGDPGDLGAAVNLKLALDGTDMVGSTLTTATAPALGRDWNALTPIYLRPNETRTLTAHWDTPADAYGNEIQSDSVTFNMNFRLVQKFTGPTPTN